MECEVLLGSQNLKRSRRKRKKKTQIFPDRCLLWNLMESSQLSSLINESVPCWWEVMPEVPSARSISTMSTALAPWWRELASPRLTQKLFRCYHATPELLFGWATWEISLQITCDFLWHFLYHRKDSPLITLPKTRARTSPPESILRWRWKVFPLQILIIHMCKATPPTPVERVTHFKLTFLEQVPYRDFKSGFLRLSINRFSKAY